IHPFADVNGRMSRLLMDYVLTRGGLPTSVVADPNADTHSTLPQWTDQVRAGLDRPYQSTLDAWARATADPTVVAFQSAPTARARGYAADFASSAPGRTAAQGAELYNIAGGNLGDPVTGLGAGADAAPTIGRAAEMVRTTGEQAVVV